MWLEQWQIGVYIKVRDIMILNRNTQTRTDGMELTARI